MSNPNTIMEKIVEAGVREGGESSKVDNWKLRPAVVISVDSSLNLVIGQFDGEGFSGAPAVDIPMISFVNNVEAGDRVFVITVPPSGNYIIKNATRGGGYSHGTAFFNPDTQNRTSNTFTNILFSAAQVDVTFAKFHSGSHIAVDFHAQAFSTTGTSIVNMGIDINGTQYDTLSTVINLANNHVPFSSTFDLPGDFLPGVYTATLLWRVSLGNVSMNASDLISVRIREES